LICEGGNCGTQFARHVILRDIIASGGGVLAGINSTLGDTAELEDITLIGAVAVCDRYNGNDTGAEPIKAGSGADGRSLPLYGRRHHATARWPPGATLVNNSKCCTICVASR
jgi:hypothetical protein